MKTHKEETGNNWQKWFVTLCVMGLGLQTLHAGAAFDFFSRSADTWEYWDNGSMPANDGSGRNWKHISYTHTVNNPNNDTDWSTGAAQLGFSYTGGSNPDEQDEATVLKGGNTPVTDTSTKYPAIYFRKVFSVSGASSYQSLALHLLRDDGAVVYINGTEVLRSNMGGTPGSAVNYTDLATAAVNNQAEHRYLKTTLNLTVSPFNTLLTEGNNIVAVEVHQSSSTSSDLSFNLEMIGFKTVSRGPYLQQGTPTSTTVKWRSTTGNRGFVRYGLSVASLSDSGQSTAVYEGTTTITDHQLTLTGLTPNTQYYYSFGRAATANPADEVVLGGADSSHYFVTSPVAGSSKPTRFLVLGDSGDKNEQVRRIRNTYYNLANTEERETDFWLMLGDNAYDTGTDTEFQDAVFNIFPDLLQRSVLWSTVGNHELNHACVLTTAPYWSIFTFPTSGQAGGVPSGTEGYYSFDYGNIHFICLNSQDSCNLQASNGPMALWLEQDLAENDKEWTIAYFHHPPYSRGTHNSDITGSGDGGRMWQMRARFLPLLEAGGVDLVLTGHSHVYERSYLLDGHYGTAGGPAGGAAEWNGAATPNTFLAGMRVQGTANGQGANAYKKAPYTPHAGAVYVTAGSGAKTAAYDGNPPIWARNFDAGGVIGQNPANYRYLDLHGTLVVDVDGGQMDVRFLRENGTIDDYFTIKKEYDNVVEATDADTLGSWDVNFFGELATLLPPAQIPGYSRAALWQDGVGMTDLGVGYFALGINDLTKVVAYSYTPQSWSWVGGSATALGSLGGGGDGALALKINGSGRIVGTSDYASGVTKAFLTQPNATISSGDSLGTLASGGNTTGVDVNDVGQVTGTGYIPALSQSHAYRYTAGRGMEDLGLSYNGNTAAQAINSRGSVVGRANSDGPLFLFRDGIGLTLFAYTSPSEDFVWDINTHGTTVGMLGPGGEMPHAWVARNSGTMLTLNDYKPSSDTSWYLREAMTINDAGQVVGLGHLNGAFNVNPTFILSPFHPNKPRVKMVSPAYGTIVSVGTVVTLTARAADFKNAAGSAGALSTVQFYMGPYQIGSTINTSGTRQNSLSTTWTSARGRWLISAVATDTQGNRHVSEPVLVSVSGMPAAGFNSGGPFPANAVNLSGTYGDADGAGDVKKVEIWEGLIKRGEASLSGGNWSFSWVGAPVGTHYNMRARAIDDTGAAVFSSAQTVVVQ